MYRIEKNGEYLKYCFSALVIFLVSHSGSSRFNLSPFLRSAKVGIKNKNLVHDIN